MNFSGIWINKQSDELIKLSGTNGSDEYLLEYSHNGNDFQNSEIISIYLSNEQHALYASSYSPHCLSGYNLKIDLYISG